MGPWRDEIEQLHVVFEQYFLGTIDTLERVEAALALDFSMVNPAGDESSRAEVMAALEAGHAHTTSLVITITEPRLLFETADIVVARYIENHQLAERTNHRLATVVFARDGEGPNGLRWRRVHETWVDPPTS